MSLRQQKGPWLLLTRSFGVAVICLLSYCGVQAIPVAHYHDNLGRVIAALDTLQQTDEGETDLAFENRFHETVDAIKSMMPRTQMVETRYDFIQVDNTWLHEELDVLQKISIKERKDRLVHLIERVRALEQRVDEVTSGSAKTTDKMAAKDRMNKILGRPEYGQQGQASSAFQRLILYLIRWLQKLLPARAPLETGQAAWVVRIAEYLVIGVSLLLLAYLSRFVAPYFMGITRRKDKKKPEARVVLGEHVAAEQSAKDLLADAESLARDGQLRAAIRKAYIALLLELGDRKVISLEQHKTNRDYLSSVRSLPGLHANMSRLTKVFEKYWYGLAQPTNSDWQEFRSVYHDALKAEN